jgi:hypothetical protein
MKTAQVILLIAVTSGCRGGEHHDSGESKGSPKDLMAIAWIGGNRQSEVAMRVIQLMKTNGIRSYTEGISATSVYVHERDVNQAVKLLIEKTDELGRDLHLENPPHRVAPPAENQK